jgi:hypothetical protein
VRTYCYGSPPTDMMAGWGHISLVGAQLLAPCWDRQGEVAVVPSLGASELEQAHTGVALDAVVAPEVLGSGIWAAGTLADAVDLERAASGHERSMGANNLRQRQEGWQKKSGREEARAEEDGQPALKRPSGL